MNTCLGCPKLSYTKYLSTDLQDTTRPKIGAEPNACIYRGFKNGVTRDDLKHAIDAGTVQQLLNPIPARKGHAFYLPSGTVHALGGGVLAAEVQTPSDTTFRVFDWNRIDPATGQPRDLHIAQALECIHFGPADFPEEHTSHVASVWTAVTTLIRCPHFAMDRVRMVAGVEQAIPLDGFVIWMILEGRCSINGAGMDKPAEFRHGQTVLIPAGLAEARVQTPEPCMWLEITVPQPSSLADYEKPPREDPHAARGFNQGLVRLNVPRSPDPT